MKKENTKRISYGTTGLTILLGFVWFFPVLMYGQSLNIPPAFDHITPEKGLSHNTVYSLIQDSQGFIWIGTRYGLNRYDGFHCKVFLPEEENPGSINGFSVLCLMEDQQGRLWAGHREAGISIFDRKSGTFSLFTPSGAESIDWSRITVRALFQDSYGQIWIGTIGSGVFLLDSEWNVISQFCTSCPGKGMPIGGDYIFDFLEDSNHTI